MAPEPPRLPWTMPTNTAAPRLNATQIETILDRMVEGEARREVEERVIPEWTEAVIAWGTAGKLRAVRVRPAHGRAASSFGIDGLEVRGRVELLDKTNNRGEAAAMLAAFRGGQGGEHV